MENKSENKVVAQFRVLTTFLFHCSEKRRGVSSRVFHNDNLPKRFEKMDCFPEDINDDVATDILPIPGDHNAITILLKCVKKVCRNL